MFNCGRLAMVVVAVLLTLGCDSKTRTGPTEAEAPAFARVFPTSPVRLPAFGSWNGSIDGGGSWSFYEEFNPTFKPHPALTIHLPGRRLVSRTCPNDFACGGTLGNSGDAFMNIIITEEHIKNDPVRFVGIIAWGDSEVFEAVVLDLTAWFSFLVPDNVGLNVNIVIENIKTFIAAQTDGVIRGTTRHVVFQ